MKPRKMKGSGIPWIGEIPEGWDTGRIKTMFRVISGATPSSGNPDFWDGDIQWVTPSDMPESGKYIKSAKRQITREGLDSCASEVVPVESIIVSNRAPIGKIALAGVPLCTNQGCKSLVANEPVCGKYFYYFLSTQSGPLNMLGQGTTFTEISTQSLSNFAIPKPSLDEQSRIATYLDEKCGEIDRVIAAKERQNELLRDQRAAVIHEAVTKGLNPKAKFKESGYEWIGKIPADWTLDKIKWLGKSIIGLTYSPEEVASDGTLVLRASNIQGGQVVYDDNVYVRKEIPDEIVLRKDDILICSRNGSRALIGKCALIDEKVAGQTFGAFMTVLRSPANRYLFHVLNSQLFSFYLSAFLTSTINQLTTENLNNMVVPMPKTPAEQQQIAAHLDARCGEIDRVMAANEGMVAKLKEYRASLIWEAVTGKKCL